MNTKILEKAQDLYDEIFYTLKINKVDSSVIDMLGQLCWVSASIFAVKNDDIEETNKLVEEPPFIYKNLYKELRKQRVPISALANILNINRAEMIEKLCNEECVNLTEAIVISNFLGGKAEYLFARSC